MKTLLSIILVFIVNNLFSQNPTELEKYSLKYIDNTSSLHLSEYFEIFDLIYPTKNDSLMNVWVRRGIERGITSTEIRESNYQITKWPFFAQIIKDYDKLRKNYYMNIDNIDAYMEVEILVANDQYVRRIGDVINGISQIEKDSIGIRLIKASERNDSTMVAHYLKQLTTKTPKEYKGLINKLMIKTDSININRLIEITSEFGWQENAWILLWHQRDSYGEENNIWSHFVPLINNEIKNGKIKDDFWEQFDSFKNKKNH